MTHWRSKLILLLVVYFAGFATAIYCLAPTPEKWKEQEQKTEKGFFYSTVKSDEFAQSFNAGMHKCIDFMKVAAGQANEFMKQKFNEGKTGG